MTAATDSEIVWHSVNSCLFCLVSASAWCIGCNDATILYAFVAFSTGKEAFVHRVVELAECFRIESHTIDLLLL